MHLYHGLIERSMSIGTGVSLVLVADATESDDASVSEAVAVLEATGARVATVVVPERGTVPSIPPDVDCIVCPDELDSTDGVTVLRTVRERVTETPFVLYAVDGDESMASAAIRAGVTDYVPVSAGVTEAVAGRALAAARAAVAALANARTRTRTRASAWSS